MASQTLAPDAKSQSKRKWIYVKKPSGTLFNYRQWFGYTLLVFLFAAPFVKIHDEPLLMFNILERKFVLFGSVFWPQDLYIFVFGMLIAMVCVVLFTVVFGRIWCGWACPQTIFLELVFRRIEYWLEGDWQQQKKADQQKHTTALYFRKGLKHLIFLLISFCISNIFLSYIIGVDALWEIVTDPVRQHIGGLIAITLFTLVFYFVFAYVREIVCIAVCPYGRLQGVLMDEKTLTIAYDHRRGEPRGARRKDDATPRGDCVDCSLCVHVCPTGIDIRKGMQMECVNCTACIDACDAVMKKINRPTKLIGFYTTQELEGKLELKPDGTPKKTNGRAIAYSTVLVILLGVFTTLLFNRSDIDGTVLRAKGSTYQQRDDGTVSNLFSLELINKTNKPMTFELKPQDPGLQIQLINPVTELDAGGTAQMSFFLIGDSQRVGTYKTKVNIDVVSENKVVETLKTTFVCPPGKGKSGE